MKNSIAVLGYLLIGVEVELEIVDLFAIWRAVGSKYELYVSKVSRGLEGIDLALIMFNHAKRVGAWYIMK